MESKKGEKETLFSEAQEHVLEMPEAKSQSSIACAPNEEDRKKDPMDPLDGLYDQNESILYSHR